MKLKDKTFFKQLLAQTSRYISILWFNPFVPNLGEYLSEGESE